MLTKEMLDELLTYNPETGELIWKFRNPDSGNFNANFGGKRAGHLKEHSGDTGDVRWYVFMRGKSYIATHLIWLMVYGYLPKDNGNVIDHINGDPTDDRLENLREVSQTTNLRNKSLQGNNTTGMMGINKIHENKWRVRIGIGDGKRKHIGYFKTFEEAVEARKEAEKEYGYHENHGR